MINLMRQRTSCLISGAFSAFSGIKRACVNAKQENKSLGGRSCYGYGIFWPCSFFGHGQCNRFRTLDRNVY